jgi:hypothetical protein
MTTTICEARAVPALHTIYLRLSGLLREEDVRPLGERCRLLTASFGGRKHFVLADLRGLVPASPEVAKLMGESIAHMRAHGVVLCAHVSDAAVARLQTLRLARAATVGDDQTVDAASVAEAERVLEEARERHYPVAHKGAG